MRPTARPASRSASLLALRLTVVRLRFLLVLAAAVGVVAAWPLLSARWDRWAHPALPAPAGVSGAIEYWCPMCPGVLSDLPGKCPVCNMTLVQRTRGEAVPLPDGVLVRMQLSPYRVQLAGIQTSPIAYLPLIREVHLVGAAATPPASSGDHAWARMEGPESDLGCLAVGQQAHLTSDATVGRGALTARVRQIGREVHPETHTVVVWLEVDAPPAELPPGALVVAHVEAPAAQQGWCRRAFSDAWLVQTTVEATAHSLASLSPIPGAAAGRSLLEAATRQALLERGLVPALPESALVDHGSTKLAYVESMPGMFDGVAVRVGPRCGDHYPVLGGLTAGQRVAIAGAFLLDAEARLNPAVAADYFGAGRTTTAPPPATPQPSTGSSDQDLIARQKVCPVTGEDLGSMGGPVKVEVAGRVVFICCEGCEAALRKDPQKYLSRLLGK
jgi:Cu(I)/Ag(I) efflux system membrane fusion protein